MEGKKYQILEKDKTKYICLVLINEIINFQHYFPVKLTGEDVFLAQYLEFMKEKGALEIKGDKYVPTDKGRKELVNLFEKYYEYLKLYDIFCAVDLSKGEFAFSSINEPMDDKQWNAFINNDRFSDVRVAVADFKGLDPIEIVFMSFLNENKFDCTANRWQYNLTGDKIWENIIEICNTAVSADYLKEQGVIEDVIKKGTDIALKLIKEAEDAQEEIDLDSGTEETVTETTEEYVDIVEMPYYGYDYWDPYYDPFYVSPIWIAPILFF